MELTPSSAESQPRMGIGEDVHVVNRPCPLNYKTQLFSPALIMWQRGGGAVPWSGVEWEVEEGRGGR